MINRLTAYTMIVCLYTFSLAFAGGSGAYFLAYSNFYSADQYKDNDGNDYASGPLADVEINVWANVLRLLHVTDLRILGGN